MKYSIIILNYNVKFFTAACLQTVQKAVQNKDAEIIVADNASTDGSKEYLSKFKNVKFLWFSQNLGFAKAYNKAVQQAKGKYLLILNPDTLVSEDILEQLSQFVRQQPRIGIVGGKMIDGTGQFLPESKRGIPTPLTAFGKITGCYKILNFPPFNAYYAPYLKPNQTGKVPVLTGAFMFLTKETYLSVGGFDERYFMYGEDIDFSYTVLKSGKENYYFHKAKIIHFKGESSQKDSRYLINFYQTTFQFYKKHFQTYPFLEFATKQILKIWLKIRQLKSANPKKISYTHTLFIGKKTHYTHILKHYAQAQHHEQIPSTINPQTLIIFDTSILNFSDIIQTMEKHQAGYRFYFPELKILIGSDYKDQVGTVIHI